MHRGRYWRSLGLLAGFLFVSVLAAKWGLDYLMDPARLPIRTIRIENQFRHLDRLALQRTLGAAVDGGFFGVDLQRVRDAALSLPWVAQARVTRVWPDRLLVEVKEQVPVARWNGEGLVNPAGEVFYPKRMDGLSLPLWLRGPEGKAAQMLAFYRRVQPGFRARGLRIREVELDRRGEWRLGLNNGMAIVVGREQKDYRIERLLGVYAVLNQEKRSIERIDLRYEQGFAVRWRPERKG
jgi:cell division protein FtsQ